MVFVLCSFQGSNVPLYRAYNQIRFLRKGDDGGGDTPLPIPNREVKPARADGTARGTSWESRSSPILFISFFWVDLLPPGVGRAILPVCRVSYRATWTGYSSRHTSIGDCCYLSGRKLEEILIAAKLSWPSGSSRLPTF